ncbi:MAG: hypothetical protein MRZ66_06705 [Clostridiales bacterium]|nr:hypothetical protein [Clostridiales bacterium]
MANLTKKEKNAEKNRRLKEREEMREKLTNWYMINLSFGILAIIVLLILRNMYRSGATLVYTQPMAWILTGVFAAAAIVVFVLGKTGKIKNKSRAYHYTEFLGVCALCSLWLALFNKIRYFAENILTKINLNLTISSYWNIRVLIIGVIAYLVIAFVYYIIKLYRVK